MADVTQCNLCVTRRNAKPLIFRYYANVTVLTDKVYTFCIKVGIETRSCRRRNVIAINKGGPLHKTGVESFENFCLLIFVCPKYKH